VRRTPSDRFVIEADGVEVRHHDKVVWRDATFAVARGEFVAVIGPNGAGKTTLFRLLLGLQRPASGALRVLGARPRRGDRRIGYVPQRHLVDDETHVEAEQLVRLGGSGDRWARPFATRAERDAAARALAAVGAQGLARRPLGALSGGELQRVFLAEALVGDPELLLLDEPLSNLDLMRARHQVGLVSRIVRDRGVAALLVAHDINPLIPHLDKVIYVANGRVATGAPRDVLTSETLSRLYDVPVEVLRDSRGNVVIVGTEEQPHHDPHHHAPERGRARGVA
jgi:zinc/manganese transport system ATP-binding protein